METFVHLVFLVSLSEAYARENVTVVYGVEGGSLSINCTYNPKENQWREKSWCKHVSKMECQHVVSARRFWMPFLKRRNGTTAIADYTHKGILTVTIDPLQKQDAGLYRCKTDFLGIVKTLRKVKVEVLTAGVRETEVPEEPRAAHSISSTPSDTEVNLQFLVVGFLGFKFLIATVILIIARNKKSRNEDESREENEHQLFPITA